MRVLQVGYGFRPFRWGGAIAYAEDLMHEFVARGHEVGFFFAGRQYPLMPRDRLRRWSRRGVAMREVQNSTLLFGGDSGTRTPEADLTHPPSEAHFEAVLDELRPQVAHLQELIGLPTALVEQLRARRIPMVMTLHDYMTLCPTLKLYDVDDRLCLRPDVGAQCARCSAGAPGNRVHLLRLTLNHEARRLPENWITPVGRPAGQLLDAVLRRRQPPAATRSGPTPAELRPPQPPPQVAARYQLRRDTNVERLNHVDVLLAPSRRTAEIYRELGVHRPAIRVLHANLPYHRGIQPQTIAQPPARVRFATLNGCASVQKGQEVVLGALERLENAGLGDRFELTVYGYVTQDVKRRLLRHAAAQYGDFYDIQELDDVLDGFHVGIVPSVWEEVYGYVGIEFLAKGIPVIGNARGGILDYLRDGETGWVNASSDAEGLARIMGDVIARPEQIVELNRSIRARRDRLITPFGEHVDAVEAVYRGLLAGAGGRGDAAA